MRRNDIPKVIALFVLYGATAKLGLGLDPVSGFATLVWAPTGIALAALLLGGSRLWPGIALAAFVVNASIGAPVLVSLGIAAGNTLEALIAAAALRRLAVGPALAKIRDVVALVLVGAVASTAVSATVGVISLRAGGMIDAAAVGNTWRAWWLGDALGDLIVAPLLLVWVRRPRLARSPARIIEAGGLLLATVVLFWLIFSDRWPAAGDSPLGQAHVLYPALIWAALRFRQQGAASATFLISMIAIAGTSAGHGPFVRETLSMSLLFLQSFMGVSAATALLLGAGMSERDRALDTAERSAQDNATLYEQAQEAVRARDEFLAIASHELKTPLTALELHVASLVRSATQESALPGPLLAKLAVIKRQNDRLGALIDNLLDVSRVMSGRLTLEPEETDLRKVLDEVVARFREPLAQAGSSLVLDAIPQCRGYWDPLRLEQIITNLLTNAIKYGEGGQIALALKMGDGGSVLLTVKDQGVGIASEDQARIFERFERAVGRKHVGGLGLGLWIVKQLVVAMGGEIRVSSEPGRGSLFTVSLPRALAQKPDREVTMGRIH